MPVTPGTSRRWELGRFRRTTLWVGIVWGIVLLPVGPAAALLSAVTSPTWFVVGFSVFWVGTCALIMSMALRETTRLILGPDGDIEAHRPIGTMRTHARRITRIGLSHPR